jgi:hypothetical protein
MNALKPPLRKIGICLLIVIADLLISGITAFPLQHKIRSIARLLKIPDGAQPEQVTGAKSGIPRICEAQRQISLDYPFLASGTDWQALAHIMVAIVFIGPLLYPARNIRVSSSMGVSPTG